MITQTIKTLYLLILNSTFAIYVGQKIQSLHWHIMYWYQYYDTDNFDNLIFEIVYNSCSIFASYIQFILKKKTKNIKKTNCHKKKWMEEVSSQVLVNVLENHLSTSCYYKKYSRTFFLLYLYGFLFMAQQKRRDALS